VSYVVSNLVIGIVTVCIVYQWDGQRSTDNLNVNITEGFIYTLTYDVAINHMGNLKQLWSALTFFTIICTGFISMVSTECYLDLCEELSQLDKLLAGCNLTAILYTYDFISCEGKEYGVRTMH
jgi:hypothetical protein